MINNTIDKEQQGNSLDFISDLNNKMGKEHSLSLYRYIYFTRSFSEDERKIIENFRKEFVSKKEDKKDIVTILESKNDYDRNVILNFIEWSDNLPKSLWRLKRRVKKILICNNEQINSQKEYEEKEDIVLNDFDIKTYIRKRWENQRNYFDKKANASQKNIAVSSVG